MPLTEFALIERYFSHCGAERADVGQIRNLSSRDACEVHEREMHRQQRSGRLDDHAQPAPAATTAPPSKLACKNLRRPVASEARSPRLPSSAFAGPGLAVPRFSFVSLFIFNFSHPLALPQRAGIVRQTPRFVRTKSCFSVGLHPGNRKRKYFPVSPFSSYTSSHAQSPVVGLPRC